MSSSLSSDFEFRWILLMWGLVLPFAEHLRGVGLFLIYMQGQPTAFYWRNEIASGNYTYNHGADVLINMPLPF